MTLKTPPFTFNIHLGKFWIIKKQTLIWVGLLILGFYLRCFLWDLSVSLHFAMAPGLPGVAFVTPELGVSKTGGCPLPPLGSMAAAKSWVCFSGRSPSQTVRYLMSAGDGASWKVESLLWSSFPQRTGSAARARYTFNSGWTRDSLFSAMPSKRLPGKSTVIASPHLPRRPEWPTEGIPGHTPSKHQGFPACHPSSDSAACCKAFQMLWCAWNNWTLTATHSGG